MLDRLKITIDIDDYDHFLKRNSLTDEFEALVKNEIYDVQLTLKKHSTIYHLEYDEESKSIKKTLLVLMKTRH